MKLALRLLSWTAVLLAALALIAFSTLMITLQVVEMDRAPLWLAFLEQLAGRLGVAALLLMLTRWTALHPRLRSLLARPRLLVGGAMGALVGIWGYLKLQEHVILDGTPTWWLFDDALISMHYAHRLVQGYGLVWNPGEYVEGYSNLLWVLVMAGVHLLPLSLAHTSLVVALINIGLAVLLLPLVDRLVVLLNGQSLTRFLTVVGMAGNLYLCYWTLEGSEVVLLALLWLWALVTLLEDARAERVRPRPFFILGLLTLVRADAFVLAGIGYLVALALFLKGQEHPLTRPLEWLRSNPFLKPLLLGWLLILTPVLLHLLWRLAYYDDYLPNTAYLKVIGVAQKIPYGLLYLTSVLYAFPLISLAAFLFPPRWDHPVRRIVWGSTLVYAGYLVAIGGDSFAFGRFLIPILPIVLVLALLATEALPTLMLRGWGGALLLLTMPLITPPVPLHTDLHGDNAALGMALRDHLPPDAVVADVWAGAPFYFSGLRGIDLLGKNDPVVAHLPARYGSLPGHNKMDLNYSLGTLRPDVVVGTAREPVTETMLQEWEEREMFWRSELYRNDLFTTHCRPYPLDLDTWRTVSVCDWSPLWSDRAGGAP